LEVIFAKKLKNSPTHPQSSVEIVCLGETCPTQSCRAGEGQKLAPPPYLGEGQKALPREARWAEGVEISI